jgi:hypothetical protein
VGVLLIGVPLARAECSAYVISAWALGSSIVPSTNELATKVRDTECTGRVSSGGEVKTDDLEERIVRGSGVVAIRGAIGNHPPYGQLS